MRKDNLEDDDRQEIGKGSYFEDDINRPVRKKDVIEKAKGCNERICSTKCKRFKDCRHPDKQG